MKQKPLGGLLPHAGFSMVETCIALMIACVVAGFALLNIDRILPSVNANESMYQVVAQLRNGRELAMAQRRNIRVVFPSENEIQLIRNDLPSGTTILSTVALDSHCKFHLFDGLPDTPDAFGNSAAVNFGSATVMTFMSDGTLVDQNNNPISGTVFFGVEDEPDTARAVTILGATGRVRSYRWNGSEWIQ
ncbi:MAG: type II secretion system protein [Acidobacteria bacterium]|nr:type II secretion system protein [Acidobacteriota bacterium]